MAFPYNGNIPQANDQLSVSQGQILINFGSIQNLIDVNHEDFTSANAGKHISSTYTRQAADKPTAGNDVAIYSKLYGRSAQSELFFRDQGNGTVNNMTASLQATQGYSFLPSGLLMKWGQITVPVINLNTAVLFQVGGNIPVFSAPPYNLQVTIASLPAITNLSAMVGTVTTTGFNIYCRAISGVVGANVPVNWFAIGIGA